MALLMLATGCFKAQPEFVNHRGAQVRGPSFIASYFLSKLIPSKVYPGKEGTREMHIEPKQRGASASVAMEAQATNKHNDQASKLNNMPTGRKTINYANKNDHQRESSAKCCFSFYQPRNFQTLLLVVGPLQASSARVAVCLPRTPVAFSLPPVYLLKLASTGNKQNWLVSTVSAPAEREAKAKKPPRGCQLCFALLCNFSV